MKILLSAITASTFLASTSLAGNWFGPGPFANGAYYPGQFDGVYSASIFGGSPSVVSGVLGFGLRNGAPSTITNSTVTNTNFIQNTIVVDPFQNYFLAFIDGRTFAGATLANINNQTDKVSGGLFNGVAQPTGTVTNTASGGFIASLTGKKDVITFSGNNTGTIQTSTNGVPVGLPNKFSLNGLKLGNQAPVGSQ